MRCSTSRFRWLFEPLAGLVLVIVAVPLSLPLVSADEPSGATDPAAATAFFESRIRPLLIEHCVSCHGDKKQESELRLDLRPADGRQIGGHALMSPGNPSESRLWQVVQFRDDDIQMPPAGKLSDTALQDLEHWLATGAFWPADATASAAPDLRDPEIARREHWAFRPLSRPEIPLTPIAGHAQRSNPIDAFIDQALAARGLTAGPPADRRTLIRRATLDLWGLPPTYDEVEAFVADTSPDAYAKLIDRLLESPQYGARWARHWLDVARYADTKGYVFTEEPKYPYSYTYRDYVIRALNEDRPIDRFIMEQLAADQLGLPADSPDLAALGFLTVGRRFLNNEHDILDDRLDVVSRGLLGLTAGCARCHDHKFDPIPTADYYSLVGVFRASPEPPDLPVIGTPADLAAFEAYQRDLSAKEAELEQFASEARTRIEKELRTELGRILEHLIKERSPARNDTLASGTPGSEPRGEYVARWKQYFDPLPDDHPLWGPLRRTLPLTAEQFTEQWPAMLGAFNTPGANALNPRLLTRLQQLAPQTVYDLARAYATVFNEVDDEWTQRKAADAAAAQLDDPATEQIRQVLYGDASPCRVRPEDGVRIYPRDLREHHRNLKAGIDALQANSPGAPPRAMIVRDQANPPPAKILLRGNPGRPGPDVPRQFFAVLTGPQRQPFTQGSGRLELAHAIAHRDNPLTARVFVNRVWLHHFGEGLVRTPSDFGVRGEAPSHPELLDYLALQFLDDGWSLKQLHRRIMLSAVYQQSSADRPDARAVDPENRLLWKLPRRRLEFEARRDSLLAMAGELNLAAGGRPVDDVLHPEATRRTIYGLVNRNDLPGVWRNFDYADPDASTPRRPQTMVPQQALFEMNSPFIRARAERIGALISREGGELREQIVLVFRRVLSRNPTETQLQQAEQFCTAAAQRVDPESQLTPLAELAQVLMLTNEAAFID